jgi:CheY-like chemotaxis protein/HPt (histidine-containing phosphotransfer) domain-containing protein
MKREKSCGAIVYHNGEQGLKLLLLKHCYGNHWSFPKGHVEAGEKEPDVTLVFRVVDTGKGMTENQVRHLFDEYSRYSRFNMEANRTSEGTGLGMNITKNLVHLMGGAIFAESELSKGSSFTVRIPQKKTGAGVLGKELVKNLQMFRANGAKQIKRAQIVFEPMPYGSVLVVDDVESNLYVVKGLLAPYKLSVDAVTSGFDAIDKIKGGKVYDIVFMDHMMPKMDGMEATRIIRGLGYAKPIVALTANALAGQAEIFLASGFDGFISKPIDVRELNSALRKFVRDKKLPEIAEGGRQPGRVRDDEQPSVTSRLRELFVRDTVKAVETLEAIYEKQGVNDEEDIRMYTVSAHGIKSALANVGENALSAFAGRLEQAGRDRDTNVMSSELGAFLNELRAVIKKHEPPKEDGVGAAEDHDPAYLREKLLTVIDACGIYDRKTVKSALAELEGKPWPRPTKELLGTMADHLLDGDFEEVSRVAKEILEA